MRDEDKTREQLIAENEILRQRAAALDGVELERRQTKKKLQESERLLRTLIDASPESIVLLDANETILLANETSARRLGRPMEKLVGNRPRDILPPKDTRERIRRFDEVVRTGKAVRFEDKRSDRYYENAMHPILDAQGTVVAVAVLAIDRTEQKRAEEALQKAHDELERRVEGRTAELAKANESLNVFRKFVEASGEGFGMSDFDGRITYVNPTLCRLFGEERPENVIGKSLSAYYPQEYLRRRKDEMIPALLRGETWLSEQTFTPRQGRPLQTSQSTFLIRDENGNPFRIAVVISDITERKRAEEVLAKQHRTLKHLLQSSDRERQLIAYEIHDGLAQQLAGAIMQLQTFDHLKDTKPRLAAKAYDAGLTMLQQGHFETRRLIAGVRPPILDESGIVPAVGHLVNEQSRLKGPKIDYHSRVDFDRLVSTLENAIYRICQEALTNACQHSKSKNVRVSLRQQKDRLRIEVRDWGVGFDTKTVRENRYGLEGIRQRAKLLGGKCNIRSKLGEGTRVIVELPAVERDDDEPDRLGRNL